MSLPATDEVCNNLLTYLDLLERWNSTYNLTAVKGREEMLTHHLFDCLAIIPALKSLVHEGSDSDDRTRQDSTANHGTPATSPCHILDVGSGAGLPGLVLAMAWPTAAITTIDAVAKKTAFQKHVIGTLRLQNARCFHSRVQAYNPSRMPDLIVCRAYASLQSFVDSVEHLVGEKTCLAAQKGRMDSSDPLPSGGWDCRIEPVVVPDLQAQRHLVIMKRT